MAIILTKMTKKTIGALVDAFVESRREKNKFITKESHAQKTLLALATSNDENHFESKKYIVDINDGLRWGFDKEAFIRDYGQEAYNRYWKQMPCKEWKVLDK